MLSELFPVSARARELHAQISRFMQERVLPAEAEIHHFNQPPDQRWQIAPLQEALKNQAKSAGLWNLFLPEISGLSNVDYALLAELMGQSLLGSECFNCSAPDTGNMEVLYRFGSDTHKTQWLQPLLEGHIRSAFAMTEPDVASSDATNIRLSMQADGDSVVLNGRKWWASGAMDPRCKVLIVMGKTDPDAALHQQQSMVIVPMDTPGLQVIRPLHVFGFDDAPHGHAELHFENVRVPKDHIILGPGRGFEIAQARLGPGRIHHCMRLIGLAERAQASAVSGSWGRRRSANTAWRNAHWHKTELKSIKRDYSRSTPQRSLTAVEPSTPAKKSP
jgi:acyl-CoA dehydrogenase